MCALNMSLLIGVDAGSGLSQLVATQDPWARFCALVEGGVK